MSEIPGNQVLDVRKVGNNGTLMSVYLKLADVAHLSGDLETERAFREHYYGTLSE